MNDWISRIIPEVKKYWIVPVLILLGAVMMSRQNLSSDAVPVSATETDSQYIAETENRVAEMLKGVDGVGECRVTITLASSGKKEYVRQDGEVLVITDKEGNESAVVSRESAPEIAGVTVACKNAGSASVRNDIIESVSTVLGIGSNKICVISMSG